MKNHKTDITVDEGMEIVRRGMACHPSQICIADSKGCAWRA